MKHIVTVGNLIKDLFMHHDTTDTLSLCCQQHKQTFLVLEEGKKIELSTLKHHVGGGAANSATACARLGNTVTLLAKVGTDVDADFLLQKLQKEHVKTDHVAQSNSHQTGISFILPCSSGNRTILIYRGANTTLIPTDIKSDIFAQKDGVYFSSLSGESAQLFESLTHAAKKEGAIVALNPGSTHLVTQFPFITAALKNIDIIIVNRSEAHTLLTQMQDASHTCTVATTKQTECPSLLSCQSSLSEKFCFDLRTFFAKIHASGPSLVVVTNGAEGVYVSDKKHIYFHKVIPTNVISTVGAGDAFAATFFSYLVNGYSIKIATQAGMLNSSAVIQHVGPQIGLLTKQQLEEKLTLIDQSLFQTF